MRRKQEVQDERIEGNGKNEDMTTGLFSLPGVRINELILKNTFRDKNICRDKKEIGMKEPVIM